MNREDSSRVPDPTSQQDRSRPRVSARLWRWIDRRTGLDRILRLSLDEPIPGGARFAYVFGSALLFLFISQAVTGVCLALYYVPAPMAAHVSVAYIVKEVAAGSFLRSLHSYGSSAMVVVLLLHFLQTCVYGSYKGRREFLWLSGCTLLLLVCGMAFTGYLLPWDQKAYAAGSVGTDIVGQVPIIGESLRRLLRGGTTMGALTISRFYVLHLLIIPALIFGLIAIHIVLFRKAGAAGPASEDPVTPHLPPELFYPNQVLIDMAFVLLVMGVLGMLAHFVPVTLGPEANPANSRYLPRPEWYFVPMFQWLKYWEGWRTVIGVVVIPALLIGLVFLLPFLDRGLERRPWRRPIPVGGVFIVLFGLLWLGMTSHLDDSRDPAIAAQLAQQIQEEDVYSRAAFQPYSAPSLSGGASSGPLDAAATRGKALFDSHGCSGCHGANGGGGVGPALTHIAGQDQPAQLTTLLKAPTAKMTAAGMVPLTISSADLTALVSYLTSLGSASAASPATAPTSASSAPAPAKAEPGATAPVSASSAPAPLKTEPGATAKPTDARTEAPPAAAVSAGKNPAATMPGETIYQSHGCAACHGAGGKGTQRAPALIDVGLRLSAVQIATVLHTPTAKMRAGGMPPVTLGDKESASLVAYLGSLKSAGQTPGQSATAKAVKQPTARPPQTATAPATPASTPTTPPSAQAPTAKAPASAPTPASAPAQTPTAPATVASKPTQPLPQPQTVPGQAGGNAPSASSSDQRGEALFSAQGCPACHGARGVGTSTAPALAKLSATMTPAALTSVLQHPTDKMRSGGMPAVNLPEADMGALVAFLQHLETPTAAPPAGATPAPGAPASTISPVASHQAAKAASPPPLNQPEIRGKALFAAHRCADCHGTDGVGGTAAAPALAGTGKSFTPAILTSMLQHPTARMQQGGMPPVSLSDDELKALVAYVSHLSAAKQ